MSTIKRFRRGLSRLKLSNIKRYIRRLSGKNTAIAISSQGTIPKVLTNTQHLFLRWNAERLNISLEESQKRYFASWSAISGGHSGSDYRSLNVLSHNVYQVLYGDTPQELYTSYAFYGPMHFLRMLSYAEPKWTSDDPIIVHLGDYSTVDIVDYGCGLAQRSRALASYLKETGKKVRLFLVDIPTIRKEFLLWLGTQTGIETIFLDCSSQTPMPELPKCDICFATEFFEHVYDPIRYFNHIHDALRQNGIIVTNVRDHQKEFMHVTPNLGAVRERIRLLEYQVIEEDQIFRKTSP